MRAVFLILLLANLLLFAAQFDAVLDLVRGAPAARAPQLNAERLRIVREPPARTVPAPDR